MSLTVCRGCRRHVRVADDRCPFCASARVPRAWVELGIAATASVGLAACYGAPARYQHYDDPTDREQHAFRMAGERAKITANARVQGCDVANTSVLKARCGKIAFEITETDSMLDVRCSGAPEAECRALIERLSQ